MNYLQINMNKVIHPVVISEGKSPIIGKEVIKSLHHISSRVTCERREVFLSKILEIE